MGRSHVAPIAQPNDFTCGPAALKLALAILGKRKSLGALTELCKTNRNGTSTKNMVAAVKKLGLPALLVQRATLKHLQSALRYPPNRERATLVSYLYEESPDSGHWAVVSSYRNRDGRIVILDSYSGQKKSYQWTEFRNRWTDFDYKRRKAGRHFKLVRHWQPQLMMVVAKEMKDLPQFRISTVKRFAHSSH